MRIQNFLLASSALAGEFYTDDGTKNSKTNLQWKWYAHSLDVNRQTPDGVNFCNKRKDITDADPFRQYYQEYKDSLGSFTDLPENYMCSSGKGTCDDPNFCYPRTEPTKIIGWIPKILVMEVDSTEKFPDGSFIHAKAKEVFNQINDKLSQEDVRDGDQGRGKMSASYYKLPSTTNPSGEITKPWFYYCVQHQPNEVQCYIMWEAATEVCAKENLFDGDINSDNSNQCTRLAALDHCREHGADLFLPGDLEMQLFTSLGMNNIEKRPGVKTQKSLDLYRNVKSYYVPLHDYNGGTISQVDYWANALFPNDPSAVERIEGRNLRILTYISQHPIYDSERFNTNGNGFKNYKNNQFAGVPSDYGPTNDQSVIDRRTYETYFPNTGFQDGNLENQPYSNITINEFYIPTTDVNGPLIKSLNPDNAYHPDITHPVTIEGRTSEHFSFSDDLMSRLFEYQNHWNAHWIYDNFEDGQEQRCWVISMKDGQPDLTRKECRQVNVRPMCKMPLKIHYEDSVCPRNLGPRVSHCGKNVRKVKVQKTTFSVKNVESKQTTHEHHRSVADAGVTRAYKEFVDEQDSRISQTNDLFTRGELSNKYGNQLPLYAFDEVFGPYCECPTCPVLRFDDDNKELDDAAANSVMASKNWDSSEKQVFCCKPGYVIQAINGFEYDEVENFPDRCVAVDCLDEYENDAKQGFWMPAQDWANPLNERRVWKDKSSVPKIHQNNRLNAQCVCGEPVCPSIDDKWTVRGNNDVGTTAEFRCSGDQILVVNGRIDASGIAT